MPKIYPLIKECTLKYRCSRFRESTVCKNMKIQSSHSRSLIRNSPVHDFPRYLGVSISTVGAFEEITHIKILKNLDQFCALDAFEQTAQC